MTTNRQFHDKSTAKGRSPLLLALCAVILLAVPHRALAQASTDNDAPTARQVDRAIAGALKHLADTQITEGPDAGSWQSPGYPAAATSLAGLAFLANGHLPGTEPYGDTVERAMQYVQQTMTSDGYLGGRGNSMYVHALCTLFGLSYMGMADDPKTNRELATWGGKAVDLIVKAQRAPKPGWEQGGWRYTPFSAESDLSVTSWQLLALHAARQCGYDIDPQVTDAAMRYVNSAFTEEGEHAGFVYRPGISREIEPSVSGTALFLKAVFEEQTDPAMLRTLAYVRQFPPTWGGTQYKGFFFFGSIYMAQGMFQIGEEEWRRLAPPLQKVLLDHQSGDGSWPFPPDNRPQSVQAGPAYPTAMSVLILSLDKQYLPMYQRQRSLYN